MISSPPAPQIPLPLFVGSVLYGGMTCIAGVLGTKQVALGPLAVEAGIFPFLVLVALSSAIAQLYSRPVAGQLVLFGLVPLVASIVLAWVVIRLPTDPRMFEPAKEAFPIVLGQSWRLMLAGIIAYGFSMTLNVQIFARLMKTDRRYSWFAGGTAALISQVVDTLVFITIAFYGVRPIGALIAGQALAKVVLSIVLVPALIALFVWTARRMEGRTRA